MARERKKAKKAAAQRQFDWEARQALHRIHVVGGKREASLALGQMMFGFIIDDANFMSRDTESMPEYSVEKHDNEMLAIAEALATPEEVTVLLERLASRALREVRTWHHQIGAARHHIRSVLDNFLDAHYFAGFQRQATVGAIIKRKLIGYQKQWNAKELRIKKLMKRTGVSRHVACAEVASQPDKSRT
jgi:hypothetical protein